MDLPEIGLREEIHGEAILPREVDDADHAADGAVGRLTEAVLVDQLTEMLTAHQRMDSRTCPCGFDQLGASHPLHVAQALAQAGLLGKVTVAHVHHYDIEKHAEHYNEGYEAAVAQGLTDDPTLAGDWLAAHDAEVSAKALEDARDEIRAKLATFPWGGRNTRAGWAATWLEYIADRIRREAGAS